MSLKRVQPDLSSWRSFQELPASPRPCVLVVCPPCHRSMLRSARKCLDEARWSFVMELICAGAVRFVHCGTPCNTFSAARKADGGPPPLRSAAQPLGLSSLSAENAALVFLGNLFVARSVEACLAVFTRGGDFSIENPLKSLLWQVPAIRSLLRRARAWLVELDQCMFGAPSMKPTTLLVSHACLLALTVRCDGSHVHEVLKGKVWSEFFQKLVFRTKLAQVYPDQLCQRFAQAVRLIWPDRGLQFMQSFHPQQKAPARATTPLEGASSGPLSTEGRGLRLPAQTWCS